MTTTLAVQHKQSLKKKIQTAWGDLVQLAGNEVLAKVAEQSLYSALEANPEVAQCTPQSVANKLRAATAAGLSISSGELGECFLIPFKGGGGTKTAQLIVGVKGYKKLLLQSGSGTLYENVIRDGDNFVHLDVDQMPRHGYDALDPKRHTKPIRGAWAAVKLTDGSVVSHVMSLAEIIEHRDKYANKANYRNASGLWHPDNLAFKKMLMKTVTLQLLKSGRVPLGRAAKELIPTEKPPAEAPSLEVPAQHLLEQSPVVTVAEGTLDAFVEEARNATTMDELEAITDRALQRYPQDAEDILATFKPFKDDLEEILDASHGAE